MLNCNLSIPERYRKLITNKGSWTRIFGLIRSDILKKSPLIGYYTGSDLTLLGELGLHGGVVDLPDVLFWRREHSRTSTRGTYQVRRKRLAWFSSDKNPITNLPEWRLNLELMRSIIRTKKTHKNIYKCSAAVFERVWNNRKFVVQDLIYAVSDICEVSSKIVLSKLKTAVLRDSSSLH